MKRSESVWGFARDELSMPCRKNGVNAFVELTAWGIRLKAKGVFMKKIINSLLVVAVSLGLSAGFARGQGRAAEKDELESRAHTINQLADQKGGMKESIHDVSVETGVPVDQLQKMHDRHPDAGPAGLMIASVLADNAKGSPENYLAKHINGKGWGAIARDNNVPLEKINDRLAKLERDLKAGASGQLHPTGREKSRGY
jgi:hypothetical protein